MARPVYGNGESKNRNSRNPRNSPKFTKSSVYINPIQSSARKSTSRKQKLSKSNVISHGINGFHEIQYCLRNPLIRTHSIENIQLVC